MTHAPPPTCERLVAQLMASTDHYAMYLHVLGLGVDTPLIELRNALRAVGLQQLAMISRFVTFNAADDDLPPLVNFVSQLVTGLRPTVDTDARPGRAPAVSFSSAAELERIKSKIAAQRPPLVDVSSPVSASEPAKLPSLGSERALPSQPVRYVTSRDLPSEQLELVKLRTQCARHVQEASPWNQRLLAGVLGTDMHGLPEKIGRADAEKLLLLISHCEMLFSKTMEGIDLQSAAKVERERPKSPQQPMKQADVEEQALEPECSTCFRLERFCSCSHKLNGQRFVINLVPSPERKE